MENFMHKLLLIILAAFSLAQMSFIHCEEGVPEIAGPELVVNGNFDVAGDGKNCPFVGWVGRSGQGGQYTFEHGTGRGGKCAKIDGAKAGRGDIHSAELFAVKAGETLRLRFYARSENLKGGAFMTLEGEPNDDGWHKVNIDATKEWKLYESRIVVPKGAKGQAEPKISLWFYHFGTGSLFIDDISLCIVKPDPVAGARSQLQRMRDWLAVADESEASQAAKAVAVKLGEALKDPKPESMLPLLRQTFSTLSHLHGGDGSFALGIANSLQKISLDEPFAGEFARTLKISLARNETEGAQAVVLSSGTDLHRLSAELDATLPGLQCSINLVGYIDTKDGNRPYQSP